MILRSVTLYRNVPIHDGNELAVGDECLRTGPMVRV